MPRIFPRLGNHRFNRCANERGASCSNDDALHLLEHFIDGSITAMCDDLQIFGGDLFKNSQK